MTDSTLSISKRAFRFFSGTVVSRITGLLRDISMAFAFGTNPSVASFMIAYRMAHLLRRLFGESAMQIVFIPHFEELKKKNEEQANLFFLNFLLNLSLFLLLLITSFICLGLFFMPNDPETKQIITLTLIMLPSLLFICLYGMTSGYLQCYHIFFRASVAPVAFNLTWIFAVLFLFYLDVSSPMNWLAFFIVLACLFQWVFLLPTTFSLLKRKLPKNPFQKLIKQKQSKFLSLKLPLFLGLIGVAATQINSALDAIFAHFASPKGPAYLWYAARIQHVPLAFFGLSISQALLPALTRAIKNTDFASYRHYLADSINKLLAILAPMTALLFLMGSNIIQLLFARGMFDQDSILQTTPCLWGYILGLIPSGIILLLAPAFYARKSYRFPTLVTLSCVSLNVLLNSIFILGLNYGPASVAFATSICSWTNCFALGIKLSKEIKGLDLKRLKRNAFQWIMCSASATLFFLFLSPYLSLTWQAHQPLLSQITLFTKQISIFTIGFILPLSLMKNKPFSLQNAKY